MQFCGVDPGYNEVLVANIATTFGSKRQYKASTTSFSAGWYFQYSHVTTSNAKIAKWQQDDPTYAAMVDNIPHSPKSCDPHKLKVSSQLWPLHSVDERLQMICPRFCPQTRKA